MLGAFFELNQAGIILIGLLGLFHASIFARRVSARKMLVNTCVIALFPRNHWAASSMLVIFVTPPLTQFFAPPS